MQTILDKILKNKRLEVDELKTKFTLKDFESSPFFSQKTRSLKAALLAHPFGIIAEIKRKSPSAGEIIQLDPKELAKSYEIGGACAISVLTDFTFFGGSTEDLMEVKKVTHLPVLRKEFIIDEIQLFQAKASGADAVLLIAEALTEQEALHFTIIAQNLGMEVLMEFHEKSQMKKINSQVDIIGVNNRDLKRQITDINTSLNSIDFLPKEKIKISESGISNSNEIQLLAQAGYRGALIGESILKNVNSEEFIKSLNPLISLS